MDGARVSRAKGVTNISRHGAADFGWGFHSCEYGRFGGGRRASDGSDRPGGAPCLFEQWQPQTENDARLRCPVRLEMEGRAVAPVLAELSARTAVQLRVRPEDAATLGERKLTLLAQGCTLKTILVQMPSALQECHWDVDRSGADPVYVLHRNDATGETLARLAEEELRRGEEKGRSTCEAPGGGGAEGAGDVTGGTGGTGEDGPAARGGR